MLDLVIFWLLLLLFKTTIPSVTLLVNGSRTFGNGCFSHLWQSKRKGNGNSIVYTRKAKWCQPVNKFPRGATVKRNTLYISICMWMYVQYGCVMCIHHDVDVYKCILRVPQTHEKLSTCSDSARNIWKEKCLQTVIVGNFFFWADLIWDIFSPLSWKRIQL